ncbi:response regulator transcription factor [Variovorax rhizosphaerae]|uniref:Response regulator n=1 Tax=Variovorax rhizosphaerae TaxID=1836200 RepID=A0ABU8X0D8_9BURK
MVEHGPFIAVVDDDSPVRTMLARVLRLANFRVADFSSGGHFLGALEVQAPACAIVDLHMPGLSGFEVLTRMRAANVHVPVILMTGSDDDALERSAIAATATRLLRKPFSSTELLTAIAAATGLQTP